MNIAIFGASGRTGGLLVERCLAAGHTVSALVRKPSEFRWRQQVRVMEGSVFDPEPVRQTLAGADAVLSALGARSLKNEGVLERAVPVVVAVMQAEGIRRIIALGGASAVAESVKRQPAPVRWFLRRFVYNGILKWPSVAQRAQLDTLRASGLDWTLVLPPVLSDRKATGRYRLDGDALPPRGMRISRSDVADFMAAQLTSAEWLGRVVYIAE